MSPTVMRHQDANMPVQYVVFCHLTKRQMLGLPRYVMKPMKNANLEATRMCYATW
jgi:hypothetical protein